MRVIKYARFCIFATVLYMMMAHKPVQVAVWLKSTLPESNLDFSGHRTLQKNPSSPHQRQCGRPTGIPHSF